MLRFLQNGMLVLLFEDVTGLVLSVWRLVKVCTLVGLTLQTWSQITMLLQLALSLFMIGFNANGVREKLRLQGLHIKKEAELAKKEQNKLRRVSRKDKGSEAGLPSATQPGFSNTRGLSPFC